MRLYPENITNWKVASKTRPIKAKPLVNIIVDKSVVTSFSRFINEVIGIQPKVCQDHSIWKTRVGCRNAVKLCSCLYDDSVVYLTRKMNVYQKYVKENTNNS